MSLFDNFKKSSEERKKEREIKKEEKRKEKEIRKAEIARINAKKKEIEEKFEIHQVITKEEKDFYHENSFLKNNSIKKMATNNIKKYEQKTLNDILKTYATIDRRYFMNKEEHFLYLNGIYPIFFAEIINHKLDIEQEIKTQGNSRGFNSGSNIISVSLPFGLSIGSVGASTTNTKYDLTSYKEVKAYILTISTLEHGFLKFTFYRNDKELVENLLYRLDVAENQKIDISKEKELYNQNTLKLMSKLENEYKALGYLD